VGGTGGRKPRQYPYHADIGNRDALCRLTPARYAAEIVKKPAILVVESESVIRLNTVQMIEDAGYAAIEASNPSDAMTILEGRGDVRAVFTDIRMSSSPNGMGWAFAVRNRWPSINVIVTSTSPISKDANFPCEWRYIQKPYGCAQITAALRELVT
jgi:DNA-binding NtrC family response regulator